MNEAKVLAVRDRVTLLPGLSEEDLCSCGLRVGDQGMVVRITSPDGRCGVLFDRKDLIWYVDPVHLERLAHAAAQI